MQRVSVTEQNGSCIDAVDFAPLKNHCSTGVMIAGGEARCKCVLQRVLDSDWVSQSQARQVCAAYSAFQQTGVLTAHVMMPQVPVVISLTVAVLPGGVRCSDPGLQDITGAVQY